MSKLVIVESPTKAKTLSGYLAKDYDVKASMGHIRDLPKSGMGIDIDHDFTPEYVVPDKAKKTLNELKKALKDKDSVILATDPDREGEAIAWHLQELLGPKRGKNKIEFKRVVFHELTKDAIEEAFKNQTDLNSDLVNAQQARRILDRLVGYKLSPLLWKKVRYGLSAGRVQSVAVRLIVERERERQAFNPEEYWTVEGKFTDTKNKRPFKAELVEYKNKKIDITDENKAKKIQSELINDSFTIKSVKKTERKKNPYPPYKTSTLQQALSNVFGFTAKRTMSSAQGLFEKGYITYHRTDSLNLSPQFVNSARTYISSNYGKEFLPEKGVFYKTKSANAQEAHEAIRPTELSRRPDKKNGMTADELKVYMMIWKRSLECQMLPAIYDQTSMEVLSETGYGFRATGSLLKFEGWMRVGKLLSVSEEEETLNILPEYSESEKVLISEITPAQHFTQPPARYSDATLIKQLEELGIGRPSTYAPTIATIQARGYVTKDNRYFIPGDFAYVVTDLLVEHFPEVIDYQFTAQMEDSLDEIANGDKEWVPVIREFYEPFEKEIVEKDKTLQKSEITTLGKSDEKCPECGHDLVIKLGKYGKFLSCSNYPECEYAKPIEDENSDNDKNQDYGKCPNCEDGTFILKTGRFGKFLACSNYPKCKTTKPYLQKIGMKCPKCNEGEVIVKKAKRKIFYGCSRYPDCDYSSWTNPMGKQKSPDETESLSSIV
ncbi:type I DNA topoisomerase [candidate division WWE3 bacterium]|jgi:DNA topoisomerase-1|uniref:DNA topoisomerase 1 n=1 Tax=candidate division WWE3 bacterium TaxID=2053526 RepID=A0A3A4ZMU5_UNCKA|nr:MAG: type I DNA topoisomerase [candidate division WWE3 bacterium]